MANVNISDLVNRLNEKGYTKKQSKEIIFDFVDVIKEEIVCGNKVKIHGFGTFESIPCKEKMGRNPKTGEIFLVQKRNKPKFNPSKELKDLVNYNEI